MNSEEKNSSSDRKNIINGDIVIGSELTSRMLREQVLQIPELSNWPEVLEIFPADDAIVRLDWQLPGVAWEAIGLPSDDILPAMAAIASLQISIILVDDLLDEEESGVYHKIGPGRTANLALALQGAAPLLIARCPVAPGIQVRATRALAEMMVATAYGQDLDVQNFDQEEEYWRVVKAKSTPFYGTALKLGGILAGADEQRIETFQQIGVLFGEAIQIMDDLEDAFQSPANSDWIQGRNNLPILYSLLAEYEGKADFLRWKADAANETFLRKAQQMLITNGSLSYCSFHLARRHREARTLISDAQLPHSAGLHRCLQIQLAPFRQMLQEIDPNLEDEFLKLL